MLYTAADVQSADTYDALSNSPVLTFGKVALSGNVNNASINGGFRSDDFSVRSAG
jgi:hypothetical protein